jgi:hypothetical protein
VTITHYRSFCSYSQFCFFLITYLYLLHYYLFLCLNITFKCCKKTYTERQQRQDTSLSNSSHSPPSILQSHFQLSSTSYLNVFIHSFISPTLFNQIFKKKITKQYRRQDTSLITPQTRWLENCENFVRTTHPAFVTILKQTPSSPSRSSTPRKPN